MSFDVVGARKAGYSDDEIFKYLSSKQESLADKLKPQGDPLTRGVKGAWKQLNPMNILEMGKQVVTSPVETAKGLIDAQTTQAVRAYDAAKEGEWSEASARAGAAMIPMAPMGQDIIDRGKETGDIAGMVGEGVGIAIAPKVYGALPKVIGKIPAAGKEAVAIAKDAGKVRPNFLNPTVTQLAIAGVAAKIDPALGALVYTGMKSGKVIKAVAKGIAERNKMSMAEAQGKALKMKEADIRRELFNQKTPEAVAIQKQVLAAEAPKPAPKAPEPPKPKATSPEAVYQEILDSVKGKGPIEAGMILKQQGVPEYLHESILKNAAKGPEAPPEFTQADINLPPDPPPPPPPGGGGAVIPTEALSGVWLKAEDIPKEVKNPSPGYESWRRRATMEAERRAKEGDPEIEQMAQEIASQAEARMLPPEPPPTAPQLPQEAIPEAPAPVGPAVAPVMAENPPPRSARRSSQATVDPRPDVVHAPPAFPGQQSRKGANNARFNRNQARLKGMRGESLSSDEIASLTDVDKRDIIRALEEKAALESPAKPPDVESKIPEFTVAQKFKAEAESKGIQTPNEKYEVTRVSDAEYAKASANPDYVPMEETVGRITAPTEKHALQAVKDLQRRGKLPAGNLDLMTPGTKPFIDVESTATQPIAKPPAEALAKLKKTRKPRNKK